MAAISPEGYERVRGSLAGGDGQRIGKYEVRREVGRGGMAVVYEAEDVELRRRVALKVIRDAESVERFHREARIAAQLQHSNIVAIHDVGSAQDGALPVHFIAMDFIEGVTLGQVMAERRANRPALLRMLEEVARAAGHAHAKGVVHRDLKPGNVMVEPGGRVVLTDFGLARADSMAALTQSNAVMGTPQYMAPEQVLGDAARVGPATDVWALGVMMYEVLCASRPFNRADPAGLFQQILQEEPTPPTRQPVAVARDLEVICLKCLEKDAAKRYANAAEVAEELARFRKGEPIQARPASMVARMGRRLAKRKAIVMTASFAIGGLLAFIYVWVTERGKALEDLRKRTETAWSAALRLRRAGDVAGMAQFAKETEEACREALARMPEAAEPHFRLGRMYRARMRDAEARAEIELALQRNPSHAGALYERIVLLTSLYRERLEELKEIHTRGQESDARARELRRRLEADVAALEEVEKGPVIDVARAIRAWTRGDNDRAVSLLRSAKSKLPENEEVVIGIATLALEARRWEESVNLWTEGIERDKGYAPHREGRAFARLAWGMELVNAGQDPAGQFGRALMDYDEALAGAPGRAPALVRRAVTHFLTGLAQGERGLSPEGAYNRAIGDCAAAIAADGGHDRAWMWRGLTRTSLAFWQMSRGEDAVVACREALTDLDKAVELNPEAPEPWMWRGVARGGQAYLAVLAGRDAPAEFERALADLEKAIERSPEDGQARMWRGSVRAGRAWFDGKGYDAVLKDFDAAIERMPGRSDPLVKRGGARVGWASRGGPMQELCDAAVIDFRAALEINPTSAEAWLGMARAHSVMAGPAKDPTALLTRAIEECGKSLATNGTNAQAWLVRATAMESLATAKGSKEEWKAAAADFAEAVKQNPALEKTVKERMERCRKMGTQD